MAEAIENKPFVDYKKRDLELFHHWKNTGDKQALGHLVNQLSPLIYSEVQRASGTLPTASLSAEAKKWAVQAIQTYDPGKGASLSTHVVGYLPKVRRLNYTYQNMVRLPENLHLKFSEYNAGIQDLQDKLNREPSDEEIAKHLGWSKGAVTKYRTSLYSDLTESGNERPSEHGQYNTSAVFLEHIYDHLSPEEKAIMDSLDSKISSAELAANIGVNINRLNYLKGKLISKIKDFRTQLGEAS